MATISRQFTNASGETVTVLAETAGRWGEAVGLITPTREEQDALRTALLAFDESRLEEVRTLLGPFADTSSVPATLITLARTSVVEGDFDAAEQLLKRAESRFPQEPQVWKALAILHRLQGRPLEELAYRRKLIFLVPQAAPGAHLAFAQAFAKAYRKEMDPPLGEMKFVSTALGARPMDDEAARRERLAFAQQLYELKPLLLEAVGHYRVASPLPAGSRDVSVGWLPLVHWCERNAIAYRRAVDLGRPGRRPVLAELSRVAVMPSFQWVPLLDEEKTAIDGFMMHRVQLQSELPESPLLMNRAGQRAEVRMPRELPLVEQPALLIGGMAQYYHQTVGFLGSLAVAEELGAPEDLPLVVNDELAPFQMELFALLGIDERRLIRVKSDEPLRFAHLWVPSRVVDAGRWIDPLLPRWYRRRLVSPAATAHRKVYLSRSDTTRRVMNEDAVIALLAARGYEVIQPEKLCVAEQIALFAEVSHIVAPNGAALTNMVYASPGARIVVLYNRFSVAGGSDFYFDALAQACGHGFVQLDCKPVDVNQVARPADADIMVDLDALRAAIE